ncbi:unnamed protein product [Peronospora belbahrii]|nr:unnamed protein product [Peronospora belbahrii]
MMDALRAQKQKLLDPEDHQPTQSLPTSTSNYSLCPRLSYQERLIGCMTCFMLGFVLSLGSTFRLAKLVHGPWKQVQTMFHSKRRYSAVVYVVFIFVTLLLCFSHTHIHHRLLLVFLSLLVQFLALVWYTLSYIPYGRSIAIGCCKRSIGLATDDDV